MTDTLLRHFELQIICLLGSLVQILWLISAHRISSFEISFFIAIFSLFISIFALLITITKFQQKFVEQRWMQMLGLQLSWHIRWYHIEYTYCIVTSTMHWMCFLLNWTIGASINSNFFYILSLVTSLILAIAFILTALEAVRNKVSDGEETFLQSGVQEIYQQF